MSKPVYPMPRVRAALPAAPLADRYERYETTPATVTLGDTEGDVIRFSGEVDSVEVRVTTNPALLRFTDRAGRESDLVRVEAGVSYEPRIACSVVRGLNATAGNNAVVFVTGKWAKRAGAVGASTDAQQA